MASKETFRDVLRARVRERAAQSSSLVEFENDEDALVEFIYGIARESFVNGLAAGKQKAPRRSGTPRTEPRTR